MHGRRLSIVGTFHTTTPRARGVASDPRPQALAGPPVGTAAGAEMRASSGAARAPSLEEEMVRKMSAHLAQAGDALARTERVLILTQAQVDGALAQVRALRVENDELAADVLALEHANSPQKSVWDAQRLGLRPLRGAAAARLSRHARREWLGALDVPFNPRLRRRFTGEDPALSSDEDDSDTAPCQWSRPYRQLSAAAQCIRIGLYPCITRRVQRSRFICAYMTLCTACRCRVPRAVLIYCAEYLIGPHIPAWACELAHS